MITSEVQRTLVKSPPELWSELSDQNSLARHLAEFGEIRITRAEPEQIVEWETELAHGCVEIEPSGWGTKVTLTVTRELAEPTGTEQENAAQIVEVCAEDASEATLTSVEQACLEPDCEQTTELDGSTESPSAEDAQPQDTAEPPSDASPAPVAISPEPEPERRGGFFARLFRRRSKPPSQAEAILPEEPEPEVELTSSVESARPEEFPTPEVLAQSICVLEPDPNSDSESAEVSESDSEDDPEPRDIAAELADAEEQTTAVLSSMLDRLGAAHHRPFSRG